MDVTDALVAAVPDWNVRVPRNEFGDMWRAAERWHGAWLPDRAHQGAVTGIVVVCRWLATVTDAAPVTRRAGRAQPSAIEAEVEAIQAAIGAARPPEWLFQPPGWGSGVIACFAWAWLGGDLPLYCFDFDEEHAASD